MSPRENLYYALGEMIYALSSVDGKIQKTEKDKLHEILTYEFSPEHPPIDYAEIVFKVFEKDHVSVQQAFDGAKHEFKLNSHYLSPKMKTHFIKVVQEVAHIYPPVTPEEQKMVNEFQAFMTTLQGDPVFYNGH
ncbi:MAG: hypothetical protein IAF38_14690 [Bacteroidia bacterium]|nr:hypothetical protein [Bacteroidia bacterium]